MGDTTTTDVSVPSNGVPTDSANQAAQANKGEEKKVAEPKQGGLGARSSAQRWAKTYLRLADKAGEVDDPLVKAALAQAEGTYAFFERAIQSKPTSQDRVDGLKEGRDGLHKTFLSDLSRLRQALRLVPGGKEFVKTLTVEKNDIATAKAFLTRTTPEHLGHNQPLLDALKRSFREFTAVDGDFKEAEGQAQADAERVAKAKKRLRLGMKLLSAAMQYAKTKQELAAEEAGESKRGPKKAA